MGKYITVGDFNIFIIIDRKKYKVSKSKEILTLLLTNMTYLKFKEHSTQWQQNIHPLHIRLNAYDTFTKMDSYSGIYFFFFLTSENILLENFKALPSISLSVHIQDFKTSLNEFKSIQIMFSGQTRNDFKSIEKSLENI